MSGQLLHRQAFMIPGAEQISCYDVVCCNKCGFVFADNIPAQPEQNEYYAASGRHLHAFELPAGLAAAHQTFYEFIRANDAPHLQIDSGILDIGCSMGHFLDRFKQDGFADIQGLEPSVSASELARDVYGIDVTPATLEDFRPQRKFDLITLCGVMEHLVALQDTVSRMGELLEADGRLFLAVPDAGSFGSAPPREPFLEFALEHVNFFTSHSLDNLLLPYGYKPIAKASKWNSFYANSYLLALYERSSGKSAELHLDQTGRSSLTRYIALSQARMLSITTTIDELRLSAEPVAVWGAGSLTSRLCATTRLMESNVVAFIDSNEDLHGQAVLGKPVHSPAWLKNNTDLTVFVASYVYADQISIILRDEFNWRGRILTLNTKTDE